MSVKEKKTVVRKVVMKFPPRLVDRPVVCELVRTYGLEFSILKAQVTPREEGLLILELRGDSESYEKALEYLKDVGIETQLLSHDILRNETRCTHCGACVTICPSGALVLDPHTRRVLFVEDKCIACELCVPACPPRAMEVHY